MWYFNQDAKNHTAGLIQQAGFNWLAHQVEWAQVETAPGVFDWTELDQIVNTANSYNLRVMLSVLHAPTFYRSASSGLTPSNPATYQTFMQAMSSRYAGKVQAYEIWHEQNLSREMGSNNVSPTVYLPLLQAGYRGVKPATPARWPCSARRAPPARTLRASRSTTWRTCSSSSRSMAVTRGTPSTTSPHIRAAFRIRLTAPRPHPSAACPAASTTTRASSPSIASGSTAT